MELFAHLQRLTEASGPSGMEGSAAAVARELWQPYVDEIEIDRMGNLIARKYGSDAEPRRSVMLAAHVDEIGLMVRKIVGYPDEKDGGSAGFLRVTGVGGVDRRHVYGQPVIVHGQRDLPGVIGGLPSHMLSSDKGGNKPYSYEDLVVDVGLPLEQLREVVSVGDFISFHQPLRRLMNGLATGKALDNRTSMAAVSVCLETLKSRRHGWDVLAVATVQEEVGLKGAMTAAHLLQPDAAVAIDVTFGRGPGAKESARTFELDAGPTLGLSPAIHPAMFARLKSAAETLELTVHTDPAARPGGTDAAGLQIARAGVPTGLVGIPLRNMHTMVETVALKDIERTGRLLAEFIAGLDEAFLDGLTRQHME